MIRGFLDVESERIHNGQRSRKLPADIQQTARRKLRQLDNAAKLNDLRIPTGNRLEQLKGSRLCGIASGSTTSGGSPSAGSTEARTMSGSRITIADDDRLDNVHPGDILREDFLIGSDISLEDVARDALIEPALLREIVSNKRDIDPSIDARLTRYFGMSDGFFLRLQVSYDVEEVKRNEADALDRIVPRAA
jgi:addiction module HigA family antidote